MTIVQEKSISFSFQAGLAPFQYEKNGTCVQGWPSGSKVVDIVATDTKAPPDQCWLIEVKDFRIVTSPPRSSNLTGLPQTMSQKVRDSLAALPVVAGTSSDNAAKTHASTCTQANAIRVVLHLEPHPAHGTHSHLFPAQYAANVLLKLRSLLADVDSTAMVVNIATTARATLPWSAS